MILLEWDDGGARKSCALMVDSLSELRPVFAEFTEWMRKVVDELFRTGGNGTWAPRSQRAQKRAVDQLAARIERVRSTQYDSLRGALRSERRRAERRLAKTPQTDSILTTRRQRSVERYEAQLAELERVAAGGARAPTGQKRLYARIERREKRARDKIEALQRGQLLGRIAQSISVKYDRTGWEMFSEIPWAGAQNEGATVGNNATLPARTFLEWTPPYIEKFVELAQAHIAGQGKKQTT
jgi:phage gpG-like protein